MTTDQPGLRERKKEATRQALADAALRLAVEHGLDAVTVDAIADAANVSRRTFSNYFANKEEAVLHHDVRRTVRLLEIVRSRPRGEPVWTTLTAAALTVLDEHAADPAWVSELRLLKSHPSLVGRFLAGYTEGERRLAAVLADRRLARTQDGALPPGPDLDDQVQAAKVHMAMRLATRVWLDDPSVPRRDVLARVLEATGRAPG